MRLFWASKSPMVMLASSTFFFKSLSCDRRFLFDFSEEALALQISSVAALASDASELILFLSFSIFDFIFVNWSICSVISWIASWCFFFKLIKTASCRILASSRSFLNFWTSDSLFLFNSICVPVAPPASSNLSPRLSSSLAKSERWRSALALACLSASSSSSNSSTLPWCSLIDFWTLPTNEDLSSSFTLSSEMSFSLLAIIFSTDLLSCSISPIISWATFSSPSSFLLCFSTSVLDLFSLLTPSSSSCRVDSSLFFMAFRWATLFSATWRSSTDLLWLSPISFFSLFNLLMTSSTWESSSLRLLMVWSLLIFSWSIFW